MAEEDLATLFAILLVLGGALLLVAPLFFRMLRNGLWAVSFIVAVPAFFVAILALSFVRLSLEAPLLLAPVVAVVVVARVASPALAYVRIRERVRALRSAPSRLVIFLGFVGLGFYVWYRTFVAPSGVALDPVLLSERLLMAVGTAFVFLRLHLRLLPKGSFHMRVLWIATILFSFAFAVVAPYAFPAYETLYGVSGIMGWLIGGAIVMKAPQAGLAPLARAVPIYGPRP